MELPKMVLPTWIIERLQYLETEKGKDVGELRIEVFCEYLKRLPEKERLPITRAVVEGFWREHKRKLNP